MTQLPYHTPLLTDDLRALGIPEPWGYGMADRTRYSELDPMGHVNNTAYLQWFEAFRVQYLVDYGLAYTGLDSPAPVLRRISVDYMAEMKLREDYVITGRTTSVRTTSLEMEYAVWSGGACRTTGYALLVMLAPDGSR
jgi:acyl-CoA thioester hydrolase